MAKITIDREKCKACFLCISFCPKALIKVGQGLNQQGVTAVEFDDKHNHCLGCQQCALICPDCCIEVYK